MTSSGEAEDAVPFEEFKRWTWLNFEKKMAERMKLSPGRVILFPSHVTEMDELMAWKANPHRHCRLLVQNALKFEEQEELPRKRPASRSSAKRR
jgi:hypothetical protein